MELLLAPELVKIYINTRAKLRKTAEEKLISQIFESDCNSFLLNKALIDLYEAQFPDQTSERDFFRDELAAFINNQSISVAATGSCLQSLLKNIETNYLRNSPQQTYISLSLNDADSTQTRFSAALVNLANKRDSIYYNLAARGKTGLTFWHHEFATNVEINSFLNYLYDLRRGHPVDIYDPFTNFDHTYHDKLIADGSRFNYFTQNIRNPVDRNDDRDKIVAKYIRVTVRRGRRTLIHERRIIFMDMIIEASNDWHNLLVSEPTWKLDVFICRETCNTIALKKPSFFV